MGEVRDDGLRAGAGPWRVSLGWGMGGLGVWVCQPWASGEIVVSREPPGRFGPFFNGRVPGGPVPRD